VAGPPAAPTGVTAYTSAITNSSGDLTVGYTLGPDNGSVITRSTASCTSSDGGVARSASHSGSTAAPIAVGPLSLRKTYTCTMTATNALGTSPASTASPSAVVGALSSAKFVAVTDSSSAGIKATFAGVVGRHVTVAISHVALTYNGGTAGGSLAFSVYDSAGTRIAGPLSFSTGAVTDLNFTPTTGQGGTETVVISPWSPATTIGTFDLAYTSA